MALTASTVRCARMLCSCKSAKRCDTLEQVPTPPFAHFNFQVPFVAGSYMHYAKTGDVTGMPAAMKVVVLTSHDATC